MFFSALIDVAGHAGKLDASFEILQEARKKGIDVGIISYSSLMGACSNVWFNRVMSIFVSPSCYQNLKQDAAILACPQLFYLQILYTTSNFYSLGYIKFLTNNFQFTCPGKKLEEGTGIIWKCHKDEDETISVDDECVNYCLV